MTIHSDASHIALAAAKHVAHGILSEGLNLVGIADGAAIHLDGNVAVVVAIEHGCVTALVVRQIEAHKAAARDGKTTATEDGAKEMAAAHVH